VFGRERHWGSVQVEVSYLNFLCGRSYSLDEAAPMAEVSVF